MQTVGTRLPSTQTVHERVFGGLSPGRPIVIPPHDIRLKKDKEKPENYRLLWAKMKPEVMKRADDMMGINMPPGLAPSALSYVNNKRRRASPTAGGS
jgi:hypothetical protein